MGNIQNVSILLVPGQRYSLHIQQICGLLRVKGTHTETFYTCVLFHIWLFLPNKTWSSEHFVIERELICYFSWLHNILLCDIVYPSFLFFFFFLFFVFLRPHPRHMEVPRLGVQLELQPLATAMPDPSHV